MIDLKDKVKCLEMSTQGFTAREIFEDYYSKIYPDAKFMTFRRALQRWKNGVSADTATLISGTYPDFEAHGATVQVNRSGEVVQAWIKQHREGINLDALIDAIKSSTTPELIQINHKVDGMHMLEIPMYDMHFPLSSYQEELNEIIELISKSEYEEINLIIGQDLFHNDDFRGRTSSGRSIDKIDIVEAWNLADDFWYNIIHYSLEHAQKVNLIYSKGNHDESLAWAFVQRMKALFPELDVDDSMKQRKCIYWNGCFVGISHGCMMKRSDPKSLRGQFTVEYPVEFSRSSVREIHVGHLHHEESVDEYGVNVRRLSTAVPTDEWSSNEGYIGAHKRFMIFEWAPGKLDSIHFI